MIKHLNPCNNSAPAAFGCPYEEWKRVSLLSHRPADTLSDVPMRNGNIVVKKVVAAYARAFGCPYEEWKHVLIDGIESAWFAFGCPYEEWKPRFDTAATSFVALSDVPMRNGNCRLQR